MTRAAFAAVFVTFALAAVASPAVGWRNIDAAHHLGGRRCSAGYLKGKVTLVCRDKELAARMEELWDSFKAKPFVLIGSYDELPKDVSYPVYRDVDVTERVITEPLFIVDATQKVRFRGKNDRRATESLVTLITDMDMPKTEKQWRKFLDYEFAELPGRAVLRYGDCKKAFPDVAKEYEAAYGELLKIPDIQKQADLVRFARGVRDLRAIRPEKKPVLKGMIESAVEKFSSLKESENPHVAQEAKNALADLAWAKAAL